MNEEKRSTWSRREFCMAAARWTAFGALVGGSVALVARNPTAAARCGRFGQRWSAAGCGDCPAAAGCPVAASCPVAVAPDSAGAADPARQAGARGPADGRSEHSIGEGDAGCEAAPGAAGRRGDES